MKIYLYKIEVQYIRVIQKYTNTEIIILDFKLDKG